MATHRESDGIASSSKLMISSIPIVSSDNDEDDGTATSARVHAPLTSKNVNQSQNGVIDTKSKKPIASERAPRLLLPVSDVDSSRRRTSVSFTASSSFGSSLVVSSDIDCVAAPSTNTAANSTRRRHRPRQTSFVESDGRVTPLEGAALIVVPPFAPTTAATTTPMVTSTNPQHPPLAPLHPGLPPAAAHGTVHHHQAQASSSTTSPRMPRLPNASGSYSLRPDLTGVEPAAGVPPVTTATAPQTVPSKQLPEDGPVAFNALQMTSLCQSGADGHGDAVGGEDVGCGCLRHCGASEPLSFSEEVSRSPSLAAENAVNGAMSTRTGEPCLFYEMGFCECVTHPPPATSVEASQSDGAGRPGLTPPTPSAAAGSHTEMHLVGVATVVQQLLRDHQRLEQHCRMLEVRCRQQSALTQSLQIEVDHLRRQTASPSTLPSVAVALPSVATTAAGAASVNRDVSAHGVHAAYPPVSRRGSMYAQRLRERTSSAQRLCALRSSAAAAGPALTVDATTLSETEETRGEKVLADALQTPKSYGRTARSASCNNTQGHSGDADAAATGDGGGLLVADCAGRLAGTGAHTHTHHSSTNSENSPHMHPPYRFLSYRRDDSLSSISQPSSDLLQTADEPEEADLLERMMSNTSTPLTEAVSLRTRMGREKFAHAGRPAAAAESCPTRRDVRFSPPSLSLISTTHRPAQFARAMGPLAGPHDGEGDIAGKQVPSPTRSPTITARDGPHGDGLHEDEDAYDGRESQGSNTPGIPKCHGMASASRRSGVYTNVPRSPPARQVQAPSRPLPSLLPNNTSLGTPALAMTKTAVLQRAPVIVARTVACGAATAAVAAAPVSLARAASAAGGGLSAQGVRTVCSQSSLKEFEKRQRQLDEAQRRAQT